MNNPRIWVMGDLSDDDCKRGMGIVVEYAGRSGTPAWTKPRPFRWDYTRFGRSDISIPARDETLDMVFAKDNAAARGFNRWTINGMAYPMDVGMAPPMFQTRQRRRYRLRMRNASDDIHPVHLHRHAFELMRIAGRPIAGVMKDVVIRDG